MNGHSLRLLFGAFFCCLIAACAGPGARRVALPAWTGAEQETSFVLWYQWDEMEVPLQGGLRAGPDGGTLILLLASGAPVGRCDYGDGGMSCRAGIGVGGGDMVHGAGIVLYEVLREGRNGSFPRVIGGWSVSRLDDADGTASFAARNPATGAAMELRMTGGGI